MKSTSSKQAPRNIFYSYAHEDEKSRAQLSKYLAPFRRAGSIKEWYDGNIEVGNEFERAINKNIYAADIIILVVTINFINSDYCWEKEMPEALALHAAGRARVVPVIIQPISVAISATPFGKLKLLPKDGKPISRWVNREAGWIDVASTIGDMLDHPDQKDTGTKTATPAATVATKAGPIPATAPAATSRRTANKVHRLIYDAQHKETITGKLVRQEGDAPVADVVANAVYDNLGKAYDFFFNVYGRHSTDNKGMPLSAVVHYGKNYDNIFWDGRNIVLGDGGNYLKNLHELEFMAHDFTYALIQYESQLEYWGESGSLMTASGHIFGCLAKQYYNKETTRQASWLFGENALSDKGIARGVYSLANPGTAYVGHPQMGTDANKFHVRDMQPVSKTKATWQSDNGGIHINCGIPSRAFYLAATMIEGYAWENAGRVWYETLLSKDLPKAASFADFARITISTAERLYQKDSIPVLAFSRGWELVGVDISKKVKAVKRDARSAKKKR